VFPRPRTPVGPLLADTSQFFDDPVNPREEDIWDAWVFAAADASRALHEWHAAAPDDRRNAYTVYRAALDREEQAAHMLAVRSGSRQRV
jgi:hypothetical protein